MSAKTVGLLGIIVSALLAVCTVGCFLLAIWTGDQRWGQTGGLGFFVTLILGAFSSLTWSDQ